MLTATFAPLVSTFVLGASAAVASTISCPFQRNPMGTTRGVPSCQVYARCKRLFDYNNCWATGS